MKAPARLATLTLVALAASVASLTALVQSHDGFPHEEHAGLFPLCNGCHAGTALPGDEKRLYPEASQCVRCHDGADLKRVDWEGPAERASNVVFAHQEHQARVEAEGEVHDCVTCHQAEGSDERMAVVGPRPEGCLTCHAHEADDHLAPGRGCAQCHVALAEVEELALTRIADFPRPVSHDAGSFLSEHTPASEPDQASCAVCHARQSCQRCHLNAAELPEIQEIRPDDRVATLVASESAEYPEPESHDADDWRWLHRDEAQASSGGCGNCHTRPSCRTCHVDGAVGPIRTLPLPDEAGRQGVVLSAEANPVHDIGFATGHKLEASAVGESCASCHAPSYCIECHEGPTSDRFHLSDFMAQHGSNAYGNESECASCHNAELFCRSCHTGTGLASEGRLDAGFHNSQPFWLLGHGQAARQGLESCTTCHSQSDCAQCHSARGGWRVNPHGPDFDPERGRDASPLQCLRCHRGDPLGGGS